MFDLHVEVLSTDLRVLESKEKIFYPIMGETSRQSYSTQLYTFPNRVTDRGSLGRYVPSIINLLNLNFSSSHILGSILLSTSSRLTAPRPVPHPSGSRAPGVVGPNIRGGLYEKPSETIKTVQTRYVGRDTGSMFKRHRSHKFRFLIYTPKVQWSYFSVSQMSPGRRSQSQGS